MTAVTGKFVLKCRTTNIATLFDISLFYVYKFYFISNLGVVSEHVVNALYGLGGGWALLLVTCYVLYVIFYFSSTISQQHS